LGRKYTVSSAQKDFFQGLISEWSLYEAIRQKILPCVKIGRRILLDEDTLNAWWRQQQEASVKQVESMEYGKIRRIQ